MSASPEVPKPIKKVPLWHLLPFSVFVLSNCALVALYHDRLVEAYERMSPWTFVIAGLAVYRIANIVANEQVTKVFRAPFVNVKEEDGEEVEVPKPRGIRETLGTLLYCPSCVGVWVAASLAYGLVFVPGPTLFFAVVFALSAAERILTEAVAAIATLSAK